MRAMRWAIGACACLVATAAGAGALDECMIRGDHATVTKCLLEAEREAQDALVKAEGDAGRKARDLDLATGRAGAAAARHLVAIERRDHRARLARQIDQDRRRRTAVLGAVVDAGEHDESRCRWHAEGEGEQERDGRHRADAGQDADHRADQRTDQAVEEIVPLQGDGKAEQQVVEEFHELLPGENGNRHGQRLDEQEYRTAGDGGAEQEDFSQPGFRARQAADEHRQKAADEQAQRHE